MTCICRHCDEKIVRRGANWFDLTGICASVCTRGSVAIRHEPRLTSDLILQVRLELLEISRMMSDAA